MSCPNIINENLSNHILNQTQKQNTSTNNLQIPPINLNTIPLSDRKKNLFPSREKEEQQKNDIHPLDFYTLGKVHNPPEYSTFFNNNRAFRSTSNDILHRNIFSINTREYIEMTKNKSLATIKDQNISQNNYMEPIGLYNSFYKSDLPQSSLNKETYSISKEKLFSKDRHSTIKKGNQISENDFSEKKKRILTDSNEKDKNSIAYNKIEKVPVKKNNNINRERNSSLKLERVSNESEKIFNKTVDVNTPFGARIKPIIKYVDPNDYSKENLKSKFLYFDKNNQQFLRHKNWWKPE